MSTPSGSMDARATPATGPTRQTTYGGVTEPSNKLRCSNLYNKGFLPSHSGYENFAHAEMLPFELESTSGMRA